MLWNIATDGRPGRRKMNAKMRLYMFVITTDLLDECSLTEIYSFLISMVDNQDSNIQEFHKLALSYTYAILYRERNDGSLRGVTFVGIDRKQQDNGKSYTVIRIGLTFFQLKYRGGPYLYTISAYLFFRELIMHPLTPLYFFGKPYSYKSYCVIAHNFKYVYPRYDLETPDFLRDMINDYGLKMKLPNETYNMDTFVLERERSKMKTFVAILDEESHKDPHIRFFVKRNPGWILGHQLMTVALVKWIDFFRVILKATLRAKQGKKNGKKKPECMKRLSNKSESFNMCSNGREMDALCHHHPGELDDFTDLDQCDHQSSVH